jgi:hypothetical protein
MAITKVIEIDVDELQAVGGLQNLDKALQEADKQTVSLKTQLREATQELQKAQTEFGDYSQAALDAAKKVATLKDQIQEAKETSQLFDPGAKFQAATGAIAAGANAVQGYQAALGLLGVEGEAAQETLLKVQSAMALSQSLSGIADSAKDFRRLAAVAQQYTIVQKAITAGQWLWNAAMAANPIGAIVAAVVALIAAGVALTKYFMDNSAAAEANAKSIKASQIALDNQSKTLESNSTALDKKQKQELAMAKASGMSAEAIRKLELKLADEKIAYEKSQRAIAMNTYEKEQNILATMRASGASEEDIKKQTALRNEAVKQYNKQNQVVGKALEERKDIEHRHNVEVLTAQTQSAKERADKEKDRREKARQELKDQQKKDLEEIKKIQDEAIKANDDSVLTEREKELNDLKIKNDAKLELLKKYGKDTTELEIQMMNEKNDIELKYQKIEEEKKKEKDEKDAKIREESEIKSKEDREKFIAAQKEFNDKLLEQEQNLQNAKRNALDSGLEILQQFAGKNKAVALGILAVQKGLAIADVVTNASKGIAVANANLAAVPIAIGPIPNPMYPIAAAGFLKTVAATKISAATNIATILATGLQGVKSITSSGGGGSASSGGVAPAGGGTTAPTFNVVGNAGVNQIQNTLGAQQPVQAYVVANQVTTQQALDRNIVSNASLG